MPQIETHTLPKITALTLLILLLKTSNATDVNAMTTSTSLRFPPQPRGHLSKNHKNDHSLHRQQRQKQQQQQQQNPREEELPMNQWYTKYKSYPEYCSTPKHMEERHIPPLKHLQQNTDDADYVDIQTKILHVSAIIRHGTRTPTKVHQCWDGFWSSDSDTSIWNCELTTLIAPPSPKAIRQCELNPQMCDNSNNNNNNNNNNVDDTSIQQTELDGKGSMFLFEKQYNALSNKDTPQLRNELNGTCQVGQLLLRGYAQELYNGQMIRGTYMKEKEQSGNTETDSSSTPSGSSSSSSSSSAIVHDSMALFDLSQYGNADQNTTSNSTMIRPYEAPYLYYRADDDQRTLMSGQVLLRGLFGDLLLEHSKELGPHVDPTIVVHTADKSRDILSVSTNKKICPRLDEMEKQIMNTTEYKQKFEESENSKQLNMLVKDELGGDGNDLEYRHSIKDCMMSTICTDRTLPNILDDYGKEGDENHYAGYGLNLFDRLQKYSYLPRNFVLTYNEAEYAKMLSGPMWVEILSNIAPYEPSLDISTDVQSQLKKPNFLPKLALFSAHDSTLHMLLASLGEDVFDGQNFAPFASYVIIELHDITKLPKELEDIFPTKKAFRLVYNGRVLTSSVQDCQSTYDIVSDLCDISKLAKVLKPFAVLERSCDKTMNDFDNDDGGLDDGNGSNGGGYTSQTKSSKGFSGSTLFFTAMMSCVLGSMATYYQINKRIPCSPSKSRLRQYDTFERNIVTGSHTAETELPDIS